jgi:hypothetical protein
MLVVLVGVATNAPKLASWADARRESSCMVCDDELRTAPGCSGASNEALFHCRCDEAALNIMSFAL